MKTTAMLSCLLALIMTTNLNAQDLFNPPVEVFAGLTSPTVNGKGFFADYDGDGKTDLGLQPLFGTSTHGWLRLYMNDGGDYFETMDQQIPTALAYELDQVGIVDVNGDNRADFLADGQIYSNSTTGDEYVATPLYANQTLSYIAHGDINGDGFIDLLAYDYGPDNTYVLYNDGIGQFGDIQELDADFNIGLGEPTPIIKDINDDGLTDIIIYPSYSDQSPFVFFQEMDGSFASITLPITKVNMDYNMDVVDLDGDGDLEFFYQKNSHHIAIMNDDGEFSVTDTLNSIGGAFHDFDLDGVPELLHYSHPNFNGVGLLVSFYDSETDSYGSASSAYQIHDGSILSGPVVIDFDHDGDLDILYGRSNGSLRPIFLLENTTIVTSIENLWSNDEYSVFPNPIQEDLFVDIRAEKQTNITMFLLSDALGNKIINEQLNYGINQIKVSNQLPHGIYFYQIKDNQGRLFASGKVVKAK